MYCPFGRQLTSRHKEMERSLGTQVMLLSAHTKRVAASEQMPPVGPKHCSE